MFKSSLDLCTFMPWISDSFDLSTYKLRLLLMCEEVEVEIVLPLELVNNLRKEFPAGNGIGQNFEFFTAKPIFKTNSLNLSCTEPPFRYHEICNFEACTVYVIESGDNVHIYLTISLQFKCWKYCLQTQMRVNISKFGVSPLPPNP